MEEPIITFGTESLIIEMLPEPVVEPLPEPVVEPLPEPESPELLPDTVIPFESKLISKGWCILS